MKVITQRAGVPGVGWEWSCVAGTDKPAAFIPSEERRLLRDHGDLDRACAERLCGRAFGLFDEPPSHTPALTLRTNGERAEVHDTGFAVLELAARHRVAVILDDEDSRCRGT